MPSTTEQKIPQLCMKYAWIDTWFGSFGTEGRPQLYKRVRRERAQSMNCLSSKARDPSGQVNTSHAVSTWVMDGAKRRGGLMCHLEARLALTSSTTTLRDTAGVKKCRNETKLREQRDNIYMKAEQRARLPFLCSLVYCKLSVLIAEMCLRFPFCLMGRLLVHLWEVF